MNARPPVPARFGSADSSRDHYARPPATSVPRLITVMAWLHPLQAGDSRLRHRDGQSRRRPVLHRSDGVKYPRWARSQARLPHQRRDQPIDSNLIQRRGDEFVVAVPMVIADNLPAPAGQLYCADNATMRVAAGSCDTGRHGRLLHDSRGEASPPHPIIGRVDELLESSVVIVATGHQMPSPVADSRRYGRLRGRRGSARNHGCALTAQGSRGMQPGRRHRRRLHKRAVGQDRCRYRVVGAWAPAGTTARRPRSGAGR